MMTDYYQQSMRALQLSSSTTSTVWIPDDYFISLGLFPLDLILPDQPNRAVRTRMLLGVGEAFSNGRPYPDMHSLIYLYLQEDLTALPRALPAPVIVQQIQ